LQRAKARAQERIGGKAAHRALELNASRARVPPSHRVERNTRLQVRSELAIERECLANTSEITDGNSSYGSF